jgi:hypothetical protein
MDPESKHPFGKSLDTEQTFVVAWTHDEHPFDVDTTARNARLRGRTGPRPAGVPVMAAALAFPSLRSRQEPTTGHRVPALGVIRGGQWEPLSDDAQELVPFEAPRLVVVPDHRTRQPLAPSIHRRPRRRVSAGVRRRRALLVVTALLVVGLALPLGGSGGSSHPSGPALAETPGQSVAYTVQPGDTLWSIAQQADPTGDPRPLVSQMEAQTGSNTVTPGQHITVP